MPWSPKFSPKFAPKFVPQYSGPSAVERAVAGFCYLSFGIIGLLYLLLSGKGNRQSPFLQFNFLQSILLGFIGWLLRFASTTLANILGGTVGLFSQGAAGYVVTPIALLDQVLTGAFFILVLYGAIWAFLGKQPEVPLISKLVRQQMR
jgi:uncharacterized membrane protein